MVSDPITSPTNPRIKSLVRLRTRRERDRTGTFLVEGYREMQRALDAGVELETVFVCEEFFLGSNEPELLEQAVASGSSLIPVASEAFSKAAYRDRPEGLLAIARQFTTDLGGIDLTGSPLVLVAEAIEKPGNLGTMLRTADAAAVSGVIVTDPSTDPFNPNVVRASLGTLFTVPLAVTDTMSAIDHFRLHGVTTVATTPDASQTYYEADLTGPVALVVGSEQYGLSRAWLDAADLNVVIPMPGSVDSLNAAMAAGIVLFEAVRQRT